MITSRDVSIKGRQEIVLIGMNMPREALISMLDACLLSDEELSLGEEEWKNFPDPFVPWQLEDISQEDEEESESVVV